jgi:sugar phosphate isomerase/epimerase
MLDRIGDAPDRVGTTVDTGWWASQGVPADEAIRALDGRVLHVHLKDIADGGGHRSCRFGEGIVPLEASVEALTRIGYRGGISVEHTPLDDDPSEAVGHDLRLLDGWLGRRAA